MANRRARGGVDPFQVARHFLFALAAGVAGAAASIALSLAVDLAAGLSGRFPWLLLALPVLGAASVLLYRALRLPAHLATDPQPSTVRNVPARMPGASAGGTRSLRRRR